MKKSVLTTTSLCAIVCAAFCFQGAAAFADTREGYDSYPESFKKTVTFNNLRDYAIGEDKYYFLENNVVWAYADNSYSAVKTDSEKTIDALYYSSGFYYGAEGKIFDFNGKEAENFSGEATGEILVNSYYYSCDGNELVIYNKNSGEQRLEGYSNLKEYGNTAYAVKENVLYKFDGAQAIECVLEYSDFSPVEFINIGDTADKLKNYSLPRLVRINQGAYMTEISDISALNGEYFKTGATSVSDAKTMLLLCKTGENDCISIVMSPQTINGKTKGVCYMLRTEDARELNRDCVDEVEDNKYATVTIAEGYIYSSPYVCEATQITGIKSGDKVEITGIVKQANNAEVLRDFYLVKLGEVTGYVPHEYVSMYSYIEKDPETTTDPDYSEEDMIKPVVLILIVIALVLIAAGYLVYVGTSGKKKHKTEEKDKKNDIK